jgi:hypothetical protein
MTRGHRWHRLDRDVLPDGADDFERDLLRIEAERLDRNRSGRVQQCGVMNAVQLNAGCNLLGRPERRPLRVEGEGQCEEPDRDQEQPTMHPNI